jgi:hypothetical protein
VTGRNEYSYSVTFDSDVFSRCSLLRALASLPLPGDGLALCGVGFDLRELAMYKFMSKAAREAVLEEFGNATIG